MRPAYILRRRIRERAAFVATVHARHQAATVSRDASVDVDQVSVCAAGLHAPQFAPAFAGLTSHDLGPSEEGQDGQKEAFRNAVVTGQSA